MSSKDEKSQAAADRIKAQALSQAKGLSRAQAERAATAAARNVNAYGQKEEGPSRWQERKEAKRQMYLMSTEKAVTLGQRKDLKASSSSSAAAGAAQCQRCLQPGHWTYECKNDPVYISRPSRTQQLKNPKLRLRPSSPIEPENPTSVDNGQKREKPERSKVKSKNSKRRHRSGSESESGSSEASVFESDGSSSATGSDSSSESSSSDSSSEDRRRTRRRRKTRKQKRTRRRDESSSDSSESDSESESDSDDSDNRKNSRRHRRRR
ncbi:zinc knuckle (CCHC-type) family protein [Wolffia australiana]